MSYMTERQQNILFEAAEVFKQKKAADTFSTNYLKELGRICVEAHEAGLSDRQISLALDSRLSRTRIQQLRTTASK